MTNNLVSAVSYLNTKQYVVEVCRDGLFNVFEIGKDGFGRKKTKVANAFTADKLIEFAVGKGFKVDEP